jgi:rhodanese-related sulfurtransferase
MNRLLLSITFMGCMLSQGCSSHSNVSSRIRSNALSPDEADMMRAELASKGRGLAWIDAQSTESWHAERIPGAVRLKLSQIGRRGRDNKDPIKVFDDDEDVEYLDLSGFVDALASSLMTAAANDAINAQIDSRTDAYKMRQRSVAELLDGSLDIIVYSEDSNSPKAKAMTKRLGEMGYRRVTMLRGGLAAWKQSGRAVDTSALAKE